MVSNTAIQQKKRAVSGVGFQWHLAVARNAQQKVEMLATTTNRWVSWPTRIFLGRRPKFTLVRALVLSVFCFLVFSFAVRPVIVDGRSMVPTISDQSLHFVNLLAYRNNHPQRGEIVVVEKDGFNTMYLKRIVGLPGETVHFQSGSLFIDDHIVQEPYLRDKGNWNMQKTTLSSNEYLVAGDNRNTARKKHMMGIVEKQYIEGKLLW